MKKGSNIAASVHARLLAGAQHRREDFNLTLQRYTAERFLYRLGASPHREQFILKGAMLFALWSGSLFRATRDLDLTGYAEDDPDKLVAIVQEICAVGSPTDGLDFLFASVRAEPIRDQGEYHGFRVKVQALLGTAKLLAPVVTRFHEIAEDERREFRSQLTDYVRLYAFLAQVLTFSDADLEKLYVFARYLRRLIPADREELPREVQQNIDMEAYRLQQTGGGAIALERRPGVLPPAGTEQSRGNDVEETEALSRIVAELNPRWTVENRQFVDRAKPAISRAAETSEFYFVPSSVRKSVCSFVRQLRGPHLSTCA